MTLRREPLTYENTLLAVARMLGWDTVAGICGVSSRSARYWAEPDCQKQIRMIDAERLDRAFIEAGGDHRPFHRLMTLRLDIAAASPLADLATLAAIAAKEAGEAISALIIAAQTDDPAAIRAARKEAEEAINALQSSVAAIETPGARA